MASKAGKGLSAIVPGVFLSIFIILIFQSNAAFAKSAYLTSFMAKYPAAASSKLNTCNLCHGSGGTSTFNPFGQAVRTVSGADITARITAVEALDSDADGFSNKTEIAALTFPGDPADKPAGGTPPPGDTTPPTVSSTSPAGNQANVATNAAVTATFSEAVDPATVTTTTFTLRGGTAAVAGTVSLGGNTATFRPSGSLAFGTTYTATITTGVKDLAGNTLAATSSWSFTTGAAPDMTPPGVSATDPADNQAGVELSATITATFSEAINPATMTPDTFVLRVGANQVTGTVSANGATATFTPAAPLFDNAAYTVTLTTGIKDLAGNALPVEYSTNFNTVAASESVFPDPTGTGGDAAGGGGCAVAGRSGTGGSLHEMAGSFGLLILAALGMAARRRMARREK